LYEDASIGIIATRGDFSDDIYTYGLAFSGSAYDELADLIPMEIGVAAGAETAFLRRTRLSEAGAALRALVP
jgi:hypothetical protein